MGALRLAGSKPRGGTNNTVAKIDSAIAGLQDDILIVSTNMAIGGKSFGTSVTGGHCTSVGYNALKSLITGSFNTAVGYKALDAITTQESNVAVGDYALIVCMTNNNTGIGSSSLSSLTTGSQNTGLGWQSGESIVTGSNNVCIRANAANSGMDAGASGNIYIGSGATTSTTTSNSIIMGMNAVCGASGKFTLPHIVHFNTPTLTTDSVGTGTLLQWGSSNSGYIVASGGTNNTVAKIDSAISSLQSSVATNTSDIATLQGSVY